MIHPRSYSTDDLSAAVRRELERRDRAPAYLLGQPSELHRVDGKAHHDELVRVDGQSMRLPAITAKDVGRSLSVANGSALAESTITCAPGDTINHGSSVDVGASRIAQFVAHKLGLWVTDGATSESASPSAESPSWEWNGVDTSQFDSVVRGLHCDSASLAVESYGGENWLAFTTNGRANFLYRDTQIAVAPIAVTMPSANYRIEYDLAAKTFAPGSAELMGAGAMARWVAGTDAGDFYGHYVIEDNSGGSSLTRIVAGTNSAGYRDEAVPYNWDRTDHVLRNSLEVSAQTIIGNAYGNSHGWTDTDAAKLTAIGQPGLICGHVSSTYDVTCAAYFRNIKVWDLS